MAAEEGRRQWHNIKPVVVCIRVNDQWRICFVRKTDGAHRVEIVD